MIFVSFGTVQYPFYRLAQVVELLPADQEVVVQAGETPIKRSSRRKTTYYKYFKYKKFVKYLKTADIIIAAAGEATVLQALYYTQTKPILFPRLKKFNEHVDDQQEFVSRFFAAKNLVIKCKNEHQVISYVRQKDKLLKKTFTKTNSRNLLVNYLKSI